jgi:hypothetical protein
LKEKERKKSIERIARERVVARVERDDAQEETYVISFIFLFAPFWGPREWLKNYSRRRLAQFGILEFYRLCLYLETLSLLRGVRESFQDVTRAKLPAKHHI